MGCRRQGGRYRLCQDRLLGQSAERARCGPDLTAVAYDGGGMTNAARVWFILQYYDLKAVILNGGWPVLASATGLLPATPAASGDFRAMPGSGAVGLVDRETLRDLLDGRGHVF